MLKKQMLMLFHKKPMVNFHSFDHGACIPILGNPSIVMANDKETVANTR